MPYTADGLEGKPPTSLPPAQDLRPYQTEVIERCRAQFAAGKSRICLVAPTGAGKTIVAAAVIAEALAADKHVLLICHTREIVGQTSKKLRDSRIAHGIVCAELTCGTYREVIVATVQTLHARALRSQRMAMPDADLLIVDEAHHIRAQTWTQIINAFPGVPLLGLTATPCRGDGHGLGEIFDVLIECPQVPELIQGGFLVGTKTYAPPPPDLRGVKIQAGDYVGRQLGERMNTDALVGDILTHWFRHADGLKTIVFAVDVAHSRHITAEFIRAGVKAEHVDGETPKKTRDAILKRLAKGTTTVVSNCRVLTEGFDLPDIQCLVLARPTRQMGLYRQMIGRGLRTADGKQHLIVLDHSGAIYAHWPVEDPIEWTLESDKRARNKFHDAKRQIKDGDGTYKSRIVDCAGCGAKRISGEACIHCGYFPQRPPKAVVFDDADLVAYDQQLRKADVTGVDAQDQAEFHAMMIWIAQSRGYDKAAGWASHKFKDKFGHWPPWGAVPKPMIPSAEIRAWVRSRDIAYAKRKAS